MKRLAYTVSGALVALALAVGTPTFAQERPSGGGGGGGGGARPGGEGGGGGGHAGPRPESGGGSSTSSGSSVGGSFSGGSSGGAIGGSFSGSGGGGGGHAVFRPSPDSTRNSGSRGSALGRSGGRSDVGDPGQRAVPRGARANDAGNPIIGTATARGNYRPQTGTTPGYWYNDSYSHYWSDYYYRMGLGWSYWGYGPWGNPWYMGLRYYGTYFDPFWWGLGYSPFLTYGCYPTMVDCDMPPSSLYGTGMYAPVMGDRFRDYAGGSDYTRAPQDQPGPRGGLKLKVQPTNAEVWVDGYFQGVVDDFDGMFQYLKLPVGGHKIEVKAKGYQALTFDARIEERDIITYKGELQKAAK